jgi:hypothetical protein
MIDRPGVDILNALPSRRNFVRSIGLLLAAALPAWMVRASSTQEIIVVDGWILADTDLR